MIGVFQLMDSNGARSDAFKCEPGELSKILEASEEAIRSQMLIVLFWAENNETLEDWRIAKNPVINVETFIALHGEGN